MCLRPLKTSGGCKVVAKATKQPSKTVSYRLVEHANSNWRECKGVESSFRQEAAGTADLKLGEGFDVRTLEFVGRVGPFATGHWVSLGSFPLSDNSH
jgi:hypothetical protein